MKKKALDSESSPTSEGRSDTDAGSSGVSRKFPELDLFRGIPFQKVEKILDHCPTRKLADNETLLEPGLPNHYLYFLLSGRLDVRLKSLESPVADVIEPGDCIGEMSIIDGQPTSAYVIAAEESEVLAVHDNVFWSKLATGPETVRNLSQVLAERMRKRNEATLRALEKELRLEQLQKELAAAYEIQSGMLPPGPALLAEVSAFDIRVRMDVVKTVGGDFYDAFRLDDDRICIAIGDVSGKGMPAALFMVRTMTVLRTELNRPKSLSECMIRFNQAMCDTNISHMFVSLIVLRIDLATGHVEYVNAGHSPILLCGRNGRFVDVKPSTGLIAGVLNDYVYEASNFELNNDDRIVLFTDGVTEARDEARKFYGIERLRNTLNGAKQESSEALIDVIFNDVERFSAGMNQSDDITVVALCYNGAESKISEVKTI